MKRAGGCRFRFEIYFRVYQDYCRVSGFIVWSLWFRVYASGLGLRVWNEDLGLAELQEDSDFRVKGS